MQDREVIDLTYEPQFSIHSEFLDAVFNNKDAHVKGADDTKAAKRQLESLLKNPKALSAQTKEQGHEKKRSSHPKKTKVQSTFKEFSEQSRSKLISRVQQDEARSWKDLMSFKNKLPKKGQEDDDILPKKRERPNDAQNLQKMADYLKKIQEEKQVVETHKRPKWTEISQTDIEKQIATEREIISKRDAPLEAAKARSEARYNVREDHSDLHAFLLNLSVDQIEYPLKGLKEIPDRFVDGSVYIDHMQPAFFEELRAAIRTSIRMISYSKASLVRLTLHLSDDDFSFLQAQDVDKTAPSCEHFRSEDFVLIVPKGSPLVDWRKSEYFFGVWEALDRRTKQFRFLKIAFFSSEIAKKYSEFHVLWVDSLIPVLREFRMIRLAEWSDMTPFIFSPSSLRVPHRLPIPQTYFDFLNSAFNDSQVKAIEEACNVLEGITLIQGPPGTGKTHTILGIISAFLMSAGLGRKPKVLVCAPSNAAIDELARRVVLKGLYNEFGDPRQDISCVRIGNWSKDQLGFRSSRRQDPPEEVKRITLSSLVSACLKEDSVHSSGQMEELKNEARQVEMDIEKEERTQSKSKLKALHTKRKTLENKILRENLALSSTDDVRKAAAAEILSKADVVFTTLSGAFSKDMELTGGGWNFVIVDEACQALELATLIPMQFDAKVVVLIGDPMQLPGTTFSKQSPRIKYNRSLFERMMVGGCPVTMLEEQYRMAPSIRAFPSLSFYNNKLRDALEVINRDQPYWFPDLPFLFIDLLDSKETRDSDLSVKNNSEAEFIAALYTHYRPFHDTALDIGIITPYKSQVNLIKQKLERRVPLYTKDIEVNTVDGFQGREKALIIFSCVRSDYIGFLDDTRRLNVAITRAKYGLWVVGNAEFLSRQPTWREFVGIAREDNLLVKVKTQFEIPSVFTVKEPLRPTRRRVPVTGPREESDELIKQHQLAYATKPKSKQRETSSKRTRAETPPKRSRYLENALKKFNEDRRPWL
jgi:hypothetical protein